MIPGKCARVIYVFTTKQKFLCRSGKVVKNFNVDNFSFHKIINQEKISQKKNCYTCNKNERIADNWII
ncbi:MAG: hypothetical protein AYK19_22065 [Theionarchaea archaeon DG-70-1]|nr:MAG: hypothetical protein AYK19_22065 [Theionarchaea archaeon DG-70-1]